MNCPSEERLISKRLSITAARLRLTPCSSAARFHLVSLTKIAVRLAELGLLIAGKWWFGPVDGFDVQMPYRIIRFLSCHACQTLWFPAFDRASYFEVSL